MLNNQKKFLITASKHETVYIAVIANIPHCLFCQEDINQNGSVVSIATNPQGLFMDIRKKAVLPTTPMYHCDNFSSVIDYPFG